MLTYRDTSSLFNISCDSNGTPVNGVDSHRSSRKKSTRNTVGTANNPGSGGGGGILPVSSSLGKTSKTARVVDNQEEEGDD